MTGLPFVHHHTEDNTDQRPTGAGEQNVSTNRLDCQDIADYLPDQIICTSKQIRDGDQVTGDRDTRKYEIPDNKTDRTKDHHE